MSIILIMIGSLLTFFSWWLLLHLSDEKVQRHFSSWLNDRLSKDKDEAESYRTFNGVMVAVVLMVMGMVLFVGGIARLFGLSG
jgi:flagellar biosynthesis protein FlhB